MKMSDALKDIKDLKVDFGVGGTLNVIYRPPSWTPAEMEALQADKDIRRIVDQIRRLVIQWDLTDDYNNLIPLEAPKPDPAIVVTDNSGEIVEQKEPEPRELHDPLMHVPISIYMKIIQAVNNDGKPDPQA
jgi:hypothetical protein